MSKRKQIMNDELLNKYINHTCTEKEQKVVREWFQTSRGTEWLLENIEADSFKEEHDFIFPASFSGEQLYSRIEQQIDTETYRTMVNRSGFTIAWKVAAAIIPLFILCSLYVNNNWNNRDEKSNLFMEVYVPQGEKREIFLRDGTRVWLNSNTKFIYPEEFSESEREVLVEGEAYFEVAKDKDKPFRVSFGGLEIEVLGTIFNVKSYSEDSSAYVALNEGSIRITDKKNSNENSYLISPGELVVYSKPDCNFKIAADPNIKRYSAWTQNDLVFYGTPLKEVIEKLGALYGVRFVVENPDLYTIRYTFSVRGESLDEIIEGMQLITPVRIIYKDNIYFICKK